MYHVLTDSDVLKYMSMKVAVHAIKRSILEQEQGTLVSPPRFRVGGGEGSLVFTAGAATTFEKVIGFRVYDTYNNGFTGHEQLVCVFDSDTGIFKGIIIGNLLGSVRTGAIGGVAIDLLSRKDARQLAVIGTGNQARTQLEAAVAVRNIEQIRVYSRNPENRLKFAVEMAKRLCVDILPVDSSKACVENADIVICATNSPVPAFDADWLKPGAHMNTVGPKSKGRHELPIGVVTQSSVIATDSIQQMHAYSEPHFLIGMPDEKRIVQLSDLLTGKAVGRTNDSDVTLFCSVGLAGTEVIVANEIMKRVRRI